MKRTEQIKRIQELVNDVGQHHARIKINADHLLFKSHVRSYASVYISRGKELLKIIKDLEEEEHAASI